MQYRMGVAKGRMTIENHGNSSIQIKVSNGFDKSELKFCSIAPQGFEKWSRNSREVAFVNVGGTGRVAALCMPSDGTATFTSDQ